MLRHEFETALFTLRPGQHIIYHTGDLAMDRKIGPNFMAVDNTAHSAWEAMEAGKVHLGQTFIRAGIYEYKAIMRERPHKKVIWAGCYDPTRSNYTKPVSPLPVLQVA